MTCGPTLSKDCAINFLISATTFYLFYIPIIVSRISELALDNDDTKSETSFLGERISAKWDGRSESAFSA